MSCNSPRAALLGAALALTTLTAVGPASADVVVTIDGPSLQKILSAVVSSEHEVTLTGGNTLKVRLDDLQVLGFEPSTLERPGKILASLAVSAPDLGMNMKLRPRVALDVVRSGDVNLLDVKLEGLEIPLPFGRFDLGGMLPPIRYPADAAFGLSGSGGDVEVQSVLTEITMDSEHVRFRLELDVVPPAAAARTGG